MRRIPACAVGKVLSRAMAAGTFSLAASAVQSPLTQARRAQCDMNPASITKGVMAKGMFDVNFIEKEVAYFLKQFEASPYRAQYTEEEVITHIHGYLILKSGAAIGDQFFYSNEKGNSAFYIVSSSHEHKLKAVRMASDFLYKNKKPEDAIAVRCFSAQADSDMVIYTAKLVPFTNPTPAEDEVDITKLAATSFLDTASPEGQKVCQNLLSRITSAVFPVCDIVDVGENIVRFSFAVNLESGNYVASLQAVVEEIPGATVMQSFCDSFSNGVHIYTLYIRGATHAVLEERSMLVGLLPNRPNNAITRLHQSLVFNAEQTVFADLIIIFAFYFTPNPQSEDYTNIRNIVAKEPNGVNRLNNLRNTLTQETMSERYMGALIAEYPDIIKEIFEDFRNGSTEETRRRLTNMIESRFKEDQRSSYDIAIFKSFVRFSSVVVKHNFFKVDKAALAFRLDPSFISELDFPRVPHGIFLFAGGQWRGFHVRFTDISRGGVRMIISTPNTYRKNKRTMFQENYNLAFTQLLKNKDIPEGGSKGTILVSSRHMNKFDRNRARRIFLQYVDALLDVIIPGEQGIVDNLKREEIIFLGPDENTAGTFPAAGALYSKRRNYSAWKSFTTGKDPILGGIPHDVYGMTTRSVRACVRGVYRMLNLREEELSKFQTGGPDGDLGSNELLQSKEKMMAMVDISASLHDPNGIDREELARLAKGRLQLKEFDRSKLSPQGFLVLVDERNVTLPDGFVVESGASFRDNFHFSKYSSADVFVPCGGRPRSVTLENVGKFLNIPDADGDAMLAGKHEALSASDLKFKMIIEGANLFITQDARLALERCGVVLIKDATANKGGVTSSSLEVYAGLALSDEEHATLMSAKNAEEAPEFYKNYVEEIKERIEHNANREFEAIWREYQKNPTMSKTLIADAMSEKNVKIRANILASDVFENKNLVRYILTNYTPQTLLAQVPIDLLMERVPVMYQHAICAMYLASEYVYTTGIDSNEFDFFIFMKNNFEKAKAAGQGP